MFLRRRKTKRALNLEVDEVFLDSRNSPAFSKESLDGSLERPIKKEVFLYLTLVFAAVLTLFFLRVGFLQIVRGQEFSERAQNNYLRFAEIIPERGAVYDREGSGLATNEFLGFLLKDAENVSKENDSGYGWARRYPVSGFLHVLGFLKRSRGNLFEGVSGLEAYYNGVLMGKLGRRIEEVDSFGEVLSSGISHPAEAGRGILTSLSGELQKRLAETIGATAEQFGFSGGAGVVLDVRSGDVLALVSVPDFDPNLLSEGTSAEDIQKLLENPNKPFFNRAVSGLYPPGSIIKMVVAAAALNEKIISPEEEIFSSGSLVIPNPYDEARPTIFKDWKAHGWVNMEEALAVSSNVYFYTVGGGFEKQKGVGAEILRKYFSLFGFGEAAGIDLLGEADGFLPDPNDSSRERSWNIGDTYNLSIGQGDLQATPLQMALYAAAIASKGTVVTPRIGKAALDENKNPVESFSSPPKRRKILHEEVFNVLQRGMRRAVTEGTAQGLSALPVKVAAKTGTAEIGKTGRVHSWSIGFFPYEDPKIAFAVLMENGSAENLVGATYVAREVIHWITQNGLLETLDK